MLPRRLSEVRALLATPEFQAWWSELQKARLEADSLQERYDELLSQTTLMEFRAELTQKNAIDTLYRAGECEDAAATMLVEASELENRSFRAVGEYEEQRYRASEAWYRLGAAERDVEEKRETGSEALQIAEQTLRGAQEEYEREERRKAELWAEVEKIWERAAEVSLLVAEQRARGRKIRREAEGLFSQAEERKKRSKTLTLEAEGASAAKEAVASRIATLLAEARERFGCASGTDFLYFQQKENPKLAFCVPLVEDRDSYNVEVKPLSVYSVEQKRGIAFLEPARSELPSPEEGDRRFEEYFLKGRRGRESSKGV